VAIAILFSIKRSEVISTCHFAKIFGKLGKESDKKRKLYMKRNYLSWSAVVVWMGLIFYLSHQPADMSNHLSTGLTENIIAAIEKAAPHSDIDIKRFNHIVRKSAHFFAYFILGLLVMNALRRSGCNGKTLIGMAILISVSFAASDEFHQLFVPGRGGQVKDVLIDSAGVSIGVFLYVLFSKIRNRNNLKSR
jgi:VanZ family protein